MDVVKVSTAYFVDRDVALFKKIANRLLHPSLGEPHVGSDISNPSSWVAGYVGEHMTMARHERPRPFVLDVGI
ncbi:MAG: hypothetical protein ABR505_04135 [Actinomycetota bacterium]